jgi:hypothetical protein
MRRIATDADYVPGRKWPEPQWVGDQLVDVIDDGGFATNGTGNHRSLDVEIEKSSDV